MTSDLPALRRTKHPLSSDTYPVDFTKQLASDETLSSVDGVTILPSGLTISGQVVNGSDFLDDFGKTVSAGKAAMLPISSGVTKTLYAIEVQVTTSKGRHPAETVFLWVDDRIRP